jgi:hypothetical protein
MSSSSLKDIGEKKRIYNPFGVDDRFEPFWAFLHESYQNRQGLLEEDVLEIKLSILRLWRQQEVFYGHL